MARTTPRRPESAATGAGDPELDTDARPDGDQPPMPGGAPGLPPEESDPNALRAERRIPGVPFRGEQPRLAEARPDVPVRRYKVVGGPTNVAMPGSGLVRFYFGKEVSEKDYNLPHLRAQGVQLKEIEAAAPAA